MRLPVLFLLALSAPAYCADVPEIRLPKIDQSKPDPTPKPVTKLGKGHWYVIDSDLPLLVLASPQGLVSTHKDAGPIRLRGLFADGKGEIETREYKGKEVWSIEAEKSGRVELLIVKTGTVDPAEVIRVTLDVDAGEGPRPPPEPGPEPTPEPKPEPTPNPAPIPDAGLRVLIVYESGKQAQMPPEQRNILYAKAVRDYLNTKCVVGPDNQTREWRIYDQDVDTTLDSDVWRKAMARPRQSVPWIVVSNGTTGFEGPLPATIDATLELIRKYER